MIRLVLILALSAMLSACVTETTGQQKAASPEKQLQTLVDLGVGYIRNREYARAKDNLSRALLIDPASPLVHNAFGLVYQLEGETEQADIHFKQAIADKTYTRAINNYGAFLFAEGRYEESIEQLEVAAVDRFYQNRPLVYENLGVAYLRLGDSVKAEEAFLRSTQLNPGQGRAMLQLAEIRFDQRNYVEARQYYQRYVNTNSQSARSLWLCVRVNRVFEDQDGEASCALLLRNIFPASEEFKMLEASRPNAAQSGDGQ
jgi:type IV pilus assembly protein PilF